MNESRAAAHPGNVPRLPATEPQRGPPLEPNDPHAALIAGPDDLLRPFHEAESPRSEFRIGTEAEKFGVDADLQPVSFDGKYSACEDFF